MSWQQYLDILKAAVAEKRQLDAQPPVACPNDGEPLTEGPDGRLFCRYDGWRPPR